MKKILLPIAFFLFSYDVLAAETNSASMENALSKKISDYCWSISTQQRSSPNTEMINAGHARTANCFEKQFAALYNLSAKNTLSDTEIRTQFKNLQNAYTPVYKNLANIYCDACGTMTDNIVSAQYSKLMENIASDLVHNIFLYDLEDRITPYKIKEK